MDLFGQALVTLGLSAAFIILMVKGPGRRMPMGAMLAAGATGIGVIALAVFFGAAGAGFGVACGAGVLAGGLALYGVLWLMERWARGGED